MACQCKVAQQIDYLHKKYGNDIPKSKKTNIRENFGIAIKNLAIEILLLPFIPFMAIYVLVKTATGKMIKIDKMVKKI